MKIYVNEYGEIKAINSTDDTSLKEIEVDRDMDFFNMSDFMILNCKYIIHEDKSIERTLNMDYKTLELLDRQQDKISILKEENEQLREGLKAVLSGDVQSLAYILYPEDFGLQVELGE